MRSRSNRSKDDRWSGRNVTLLQGERQHLDGETLLQMRERTQELKRQRLVSIAEKKEQNVAEGAEQGRT